jgi:O-antigen ligase
LSALAAEPPGAAVNRKLIELLGAAAVGLGVFLSGFVIREPAPFDLFMAALIAVWALFGLRLSRSVMPLLVLLVLFNLGGLVSMSQLADLGDTPLYIAVSFFLALIAVFFAAVLEARPHYFPLIFKAWVAAACGTSLLGIAGYFHAFPGAGMFTVYSRAAGAFQDPNVFGPFLVAPALFLLHGILTDRLRRLSLYTLPLLVIAAGLFLSFSRGAWGLFAVSAAMMMGALFLRSRSNAFRLRIALMGAAAAALLILAVLVVLQLPGVAELFETRAQVVQDYDGARLGRFARHLLGFQLALEHPFGIGLLMFDDLYGEDTHNIWLKAILEYSWLGFASYVALILWTLGAGFRILFRDRPWQPFLLCAYLALVGHVVLGAVIDTDHWRHFYLLLGLVWGAIALERRRQRGFLAGASMRRPPNGVDPAAVSPYIPARFGA